MSQVAHSLAQLEIAYAAFQAHALARVSKRDRAFIETNMAETRDVAAEQVAAFDCGAARCFADFMAARTKAAGRVEWVDYVAPAAPVASDPVPADVPCYLAVAYHDGAETIMGVFRVAEYASPQAAEAEASKLCDRIRAAAPLASYGTRWSNGKAAEGERSDCPAERDMEDAARVKAESREAHGFKRGQAVRVRDGYEFGNATRTGEVVTQLHGSQPAWAVRCEFGGVVHYMRPDGIEAVPARAASPILQRLAEANAALDDCERRKRAASSDSVFQHTTLRSEWNRLFDARESLQAMAEDADPIAYVRAYPRHAMAYRHLLPADMVERINAAEDDAAMRAAVGAPAMVPQVAQQQQANAGDLSVGRKHSTKADGTPRKGWFDARCINAKSAPYLTEGQVYRLREVRNGWWETEGGDRMAQFRFERIAPAMVPQPCQPQQGQAGGLELPPGYSLDQDSDGDWVLIPPADVTIFSVPGEPLLIGPCDRATALYDAIEHLQGIDISGN